MSVYTFNRKCDVLASVDLPSYISMSRLEFIRKRQSLQRTIIKQGYLKKLPNAANFGSSFKVSLCLLIVFYVTL